MGTVFKDSVDAFVRVIARQMGILALTDGECALVVAAVAGARGRAMVTPEEMISARALPKPDPEFRPNRVLDAAQAIGQTGHPLVRLALALVDLDPRGILSARGLDICDLYCVTVRLLMRRAEA